jgi:hypothetical protein
LAVVANFHAYKFEDFELATIFHIYALKTAIRMFPHNKKLPEQLNQVFCELRKEYDDEFDHIAVRLANTVLMVGEINVSYLNFFNKNGVKELVRMYYDYVIILELNGYKSVISQSRECSSQFLSSIVQM